MFPERLEVEFREARWDCFWKTKWDKLGKNSEIDCYILSQLLLQQALNWLYKGEHKQWCVWFFSILLIDLSQVSETQQVIQEMTIKQLLVSTVDWDVGSSLLIQDLRMEREGRNVAGNLCYMCGDKTMWGMQCVRHNLYLISRWSVRKSALVSHISHLARQHNGTDRHKRLDCCAKLNF